MVRRKGIKNQMVNRDAENSNNESPTDKLKDYIIVEYLTKTTNKFDVFAIFPQPNSFEHLLEITYVLSTP